MSLFLSSDFSLLRGVTAVLALALLMTGCDSAGDESAPIGPGTFEAEATGALTQSLHGEASFALVEAGPGIEAGLFFHLNAGSVTLPPPSTWDPIATGLFLVAEGDRTPGRYRVRGGDLNNRAVLPLRIGAAPAIPVFYKVTEGTLTLTDVEAGRVRGTFEVMAEGGIPLPSGETAVRVSGSFDALPSPE